MKCRGSNSPMKGFPGTLYSSSILTCHGSIFSFVPLSWLNLSPLLDYKFCEDWDVRSIFFLSLEPFIKIDWILSAHLILTKLMHEWVIRKTVGWMKSGHDPFDSPHFLINQILWSSASSTTRTRTYTSVATHTSQSTHFKGNPYFDL